MHFWSLLKILTFDFPTCNYNLEFYLVQVDIKLDQGPLKKWTKNPIPHRKEPQGQPLCGWYGSFLSLCCNPKTLHFHLSIEGSNMAIVWHLASYNKLKKRAWFRMCKRILQMFNKISILCKKCKIWPSSYLWHAVLWSYFLKVLQRLIMFMLV